MRGTIEEKVMSLQNFKVSVANAVINADNASLTTMNTDSLLDLFTPPATISHKVISVSLSLSLSLSFSLLFLSHFLPMSCSPCSFFSFRIFASTFVPSTRSLSLYFSLSLSIHLSIFWASPIDFAFLAVTFPPSLSLSFFWSSCTGICCSFSIYVF